MDSKFLAENSHLKAPKTFIDQDPHLSQLKSLPYLYESELLSLFPFDTPGIYTLTGGGLTGKTIILKQWMQKLIETEVAPEAIVFFPGVLFKNNYQLIDAVQDYLKRTSTESVRYVIIDDVIYIEDWLKAIKLLVELGLLDHVVMMLSSANRTLKDTIHEHFPDRVSRETQNDFHLYPLTFREYVELKHKNTQLHDLHLYEDFDQYLLHGGYLAAINDIALHGNITNSTLERYLDWLRQEIQQQGKQEQFVREILGGIIEHYNDQISWNKLSQELTISHTKTIGDYITLLEHLDVVFVQAALKENKHQGAPKRGRKLMFRDPFIFHAIRAFLNGNKTNHFELEIKLILTADKLYSLLAKTCVISHYSLYYKTYYIKGDGEIDLAFICEEKVWPIAITWTNQLRGKDLKELLKYPNSKILAKIQHPTIIENIRTEPLPYVLWKLKKQKLL